MLVRIGISEVLLPGRLQGNDIETYASSVE